MAGQKIKCPGCDCKVSLAEVEKNDGACPECGQDLFGFESSLFDDYENEDDEDLELEESEESEFDDEEEEFDDEYDEDDEDSDEDDELNDDSL